MGSIFTIFMVIILVLTGCGISDPQSKQKGIPDTEERQKKQHDEVVHTLTKERNDDLFIAGWLSDEEVLYAKSSGESYLLVSFNIHTGEKKKIYQFKEPVITAKVSPSGKYAIVHTGISEFEARISVFTLEDKEIVFEETFESKEISYEWNEYDESKILLIAFADDWSYSSFIIDTSAKNVHKIALSDPFSIWHNDSTLLYLDSDPQKNGTAAPIIKYNYRTGKKEAVSSERYSFLRGWKNVYMAAAPDEKLDDFTEIVFFNEEFEEISRFSIPFPAHMAGWPPPYIDMTKHQVFFFVEPKKVKNVETNSYRTDNRLIKRNIVTGIESVVIDNLPDGPVLCNPSGTYCITGYLYENIINVEEKKIYPFVEEKE